MNNFQNDGRDNGDGDWDRNDTFIEYNDDEEEDSEFEYCSQLLDGILDGNLESLVESLISGNETVLENLQTLNKDLKELFNQKTKFGCTPLHIATLKEREDWINYLIDNVIPICFNDFKTIHPKLIITIY